jgi:hypothetical protein
MMTCVAERTGPDGQLTGLHKAWTMSFLRSWWIHSNLTGADTSWGMGKAAARLLNVSSFDMEDPETSWLDFPPERRVERLQTLQGRLMTGMVQMQ